MITIHGTTTIQAPIDRCFRLSVSIDIVAATLARIGLRPTAGITRGEIAANETVTWHAPLLRTTHRSHISGYTFPTYFQDTMLEGRFTFFQHDHHLAATPEGTRLTDEIRFIAPFGPFGRLAERTFLKPLATRLLSHRFAQLKRIAEDDSPTGWKRYLQP